MPLVRADLVRLLETPNRKPRWLRSPDGALSGAVLNEGWKRILRSKISIHDIQDWAR